VNQITHNWLNTRRYPVLRTGQQARNVACYMIVHGSKRLLKLVTTMFELDMEAHVAMV
jgi:hypothetical protein